LANDIEWQCGKAAVGVGIKQVQTKGSNMKK